MPTRPPDSERWLYVSLPHATFALAAKDGKITDAAPIARWAIGKSEREVAAYYRRKGAIFADLRKLTGGEQDRGRSGP